MVLARRAGTSLCRSVRSDYLGDGLRRIAGCPFQCGKDEGAKATEAGLCLARQIFFHGVVRTDIHYYMYLPVWYLAENITVSTVSLMATRAARG